MEKSEEEFFLRNKQSEIRHNQCKSCYKITRRYHEHYTKYKGEYVKRAMTRMQRLKKENRLKIIDYLKDKCCCVCGEMDMVVLDFDHKDRSQKVDSVSRLVSNGSSWEKIIAEIEKCEIFCSNCHRKRTAKQFGWLKGTVTQVGRGLSAKEL